MLSASQPAISKGLEILVPADPSKRFCLIFRSYFCENPPMLKHDFCKGHQHHNQLQGTATKAKTRAKQVMKGAASCSVVHCCVPAPKGQDPDHTTSLTFPHQSQGWHEAQLHKDSKHKKCKELLAAACWWLPQGLAGQPGYAAAPVSHRCTARQAFTRVLQELRLYYCLSKSIPTLSNAKPNLWVHMEETDTDTSKFSSFGLLYVLNTLFDARISCVRCHQ